MKVKFQETKIMDAVYTYASRACCRVQIILMRYGLRVKRRRMYKYMKNNTQNICTRHKL